MSETVEKVRPLLEPLLVYGEAVVAAMDGVSLRSDPGASAAAAVALGGAIGGMVHGMTKPGKSSQAVSAALREIGVSRAMVWALSNRRLFVVRASPITGKPKRVLGAHLVPHSVEYVSHSTGKAKRATLLLKLYGLGVSVTAPAEELVPFAEQLASRRSTQS